MARGPGTRSQSPEPCPAAGIRTVYWTRWCRSSVRCCSRRSPFLAGQLGGCPTSATRQATGGDCHSQVLRRPGILSARRSLCRPFNRKASKSGDVTVMRTAGPGHRVSRKACDQMTAIITRWVTDPAQVHRGRQDSRRHRVPLRRPTRTRWLACHRRPVAPVPCLRRLRLQGLLSALLFQVRAL